VNIYRRLGKRLLDTSLVVFFSPLAIPVTALVWLLVRSKLGAPALFVQVRPGLHGRPFVLRKFRTMVDAVDAVGVQLPDEQRLTQFGRFLRAASLDELPQLANVLRGDMSLVGPRPLLMEYLTRYSAKQRRRHDVRPGITGLAQIRGRNAATWEEKFAWDIEYVERCSMGLDLWILAKTVGTVLRRKGINQPGRATMEEFLGSDIRRSR
jgi:sugar transferase EpsL